MRSGASTDWRRPPLFERRSWAGGSEEERGIVVLRAQRAAKMSVCYLWRV